MTNLIHTETVTLSLELSTELYNKLLHVAKSYTEDVTNFTPQELVKDYLRRMIIDEVDNPPVIDSDLPNPVESFERAWGQAMRGEGRSADEVLEELQRERESEGE